MEEIITTIINNIINNFDFTFCAIVNILTYLIIKTINDINPKIKLGTWHKRFIFLITSIIVAIAYYATGSDAKVLFNSIILAPISWSWIFKPICAKLNIDYKKDNTTGNSADNNIGDIF